MADLEKLVLQHVAKEKYRTSRVDVEPSTSSVRRYVTKWVKEWHGSQ